MIIVEHRASIILYNLLKSIDHDKVFLIPANICPIVACTFLKVQRKFELVDISNKTFCIDEELVLQKLRDYPDKYAGVIFARTYGIMVSFEHIFKRIKNINKEIFIIDDRCLTIPEFTQAKPTSADVVLFSTGYSKYVDIGWGGFAFLNNGKINYIRNQLPYNEDDLKVLTGRLKEAMAARKKFEYSDSAWLGDTKAKIEFRAYKELVESRLTKVRKTKQILNNIYSQMLPKEIQLKKDYQLWRFNILVNQKQRLLDKIFEQRLFASSHYAPLTGIFQEGHVDNATRLYDKIINLFNDFHFDEEKAVKICKILNDHLKTRGNLC